MRKRSNTQKVGWMKHELTRTSPKIDSHQRQLNSKQSESSFQHKARKVETDCLDCRDKSTTSRSTQCWANQSGKDWNGEQVDSEQSDSVLSKTKEERLRRTQDYNEQSDLRSWANHGNNDWDGGKSTTSRVTGSVEQNKARFKIEIQRLSTLR